MSRLTLRCAPRHSLAAEVGANPRPQEHDAEVVAMSAMYHQQSLAQTWKRRRRRQRILLAVVIIVLLVALLYGWLHVFGVF
jgi:hypothetical protein